MKYFCALVFSLLTSSAMAGTSAGYGMGGQFSRFDPVVAEHNRTGELFRIEGHCQSACTGVSRHQKRLRAAERAAAISCRARSTAQYQYKMDQPYAGGIQAGTPAIPGLQSLHGHARVPHHLRARTDRQVRLQGVSVTSPYPFVASKADPGARH